MNFKLMLFRLYVIPLFFLVFSLVFASFIPESHIHSDSRTMNLSDMISSQLLYPFLKVLEWIPLGLFIIAVITMLWSTYRCITWCLGWHSFTCPHCDGIVSSTKFGRYGPYVKCLACGRNTSLR